MRISDWSSDGCSSDLTRYAGAGAPALMRKSHFRLFHDLRRITTHVVAQVWKHGDVVAEYRRCRACRPVIDDPDGEFAASHTRTTGVERADRTSTRLNSSH